MTSVYRIGDFIDLCTGPHIENTGLAKGFAITKHSASYWLGDAKSSSLIKNLRSCIPREGIARRVSKIERGSPKKS
jgi:threonyl-tRNA synthetase